MSFRTTRVWVLASLCLLVLAAPLAWGQASSVIKTAPALPAPTGTVIDVYNVTQFYSAISSATSGTTIMIHPGTYALSSVPQLTHAGVTIRGSSGNRDDVVLVGSGMNTSSPGSQYGFQINVTSTPAVPMVIADLTISGVYYHGIQIRGENSVSNVLIHNVKILNAGERFIKGSTATGKIAANITIEYCWLEQNQTYVSRPGNTVDPDNYIGGIDAIGLNNWQIHDCVIKNIQGLTGGGRGGIFLWGGVTNSVAERNCIMGCDRDIAFGNPSRSVPYHSTDCIIRNNFVVGGASYALEICASNNMKVYNNTVYCSNSGASAIHVYDGVTTGLKIYSDIIRGQILLDNAGGTVSADTTGSITGSTPPASWFVDPLNADLRINATATAAINTAQVLSEVTDDYFANPRGGQPDKGAYELPPPPPPHVTAVTPALGHVYGKEIPLTAISFTFDKNITINSGMVSVLGLNTGVNSGFTVSYNLLTYTATLQWPADLPNDTYQVTLTDSITAAGAALDGEINKLIPVLPSGNGTAGGSFVCLVYRLAGDTNQDRSVDVVDLLNLVATFGLVSGDPGFDSTCDFNNDGGVDVIDLLDLVANFGQTIPQQ